MDAWQPAFVATLATDHEVVMFDNAGVGETATVASTPSITEMANHKLGVVTAGIDVELRRHPAAQETPRIIHVLFEEEIERTGRDECRWQPCKRFRARG